MYSGCQTVATCWIPTTNMLDGVGFNSFFLKMFDEMFGKIKNFIQRFPMELFDTFNQYCWNWAWNSPYSSQNFNLEDLNVKKTFLLTHCHSSLESIFTSLSDEEINVNKKKRKFSIKSSKTKWDENHVEDLLDFYQIVYCLWDIFIYISC